VCGCAWLVCKAKQPQQPHNLVMHVCVYNGNKLASTFSGTEANSIAEPLLVKQGQCSGPHLPLLLGRVLTSVACSAVLLPTPPPAAAFREAPAPR
jgi:hypothetical protein